MPKVKIGLQPAVITYKTEGTKPGRERKSTYIWCLPSSSARVVEYQVRTDRTLDALESVDKRDHLLT